MTKQIEREQAISLITATYKDRSGLCDRYIKLLDEAEKKSSEEGQKPAKYALAIRKAYSEVRVYIYDACKNRYLWEATVAVYNQ